jgi:hypothetical protein
MRLPPVRFTVRGMMLVVAVAAACLGGCARGRRLLDLRAGYLRKADGYRREAAPISAALGLRNGGPVGDEQDDGRRLRKAVAADGARLTRLVRLRERYERAARSPWLPVEPDPPGPR